MIIQLFTMHSGACTLCLSINRKTNNINNTYLQPLFEKLADLKIDNVECWMCFICHRRLQQCHQLWKLAEHTRSIFMRSIMGIQGDKKVVLFGSVKSLLKLSTSKQIDICIQSSAAREELIVNVKREPFNEGVEVQDADTEDSTACDYEHSTQDIKHVSEAKVKPEPVDVQGEREVLKEECVQENVTVNRSDEQTETQLSSTDGDQSQSLKTSDEVLRMPKMLTLEVDELKANICEYISKKSATDSTCGDAVDPTSDTRDGAAVAAAAHRSGSPSATGGHTCSICNRHFTEKRNLLAHLGKVHAGDKPFTCHICDHTFTQKRGLQVHVKVYHTHSGPFVCDICQRPFSLKRNLVSHLKLHANDRPFNCDICQKKFTLKKNLHNHLRIHTEQKLSCGVCARRFTQNDSLQEHLRLHTGEKPFSCDICQSKFTRRNVLQRHLRAHAREKPFRCDICRRRFLQKSDLQLHVRNHTGEKPFSCYFCPRKFLYDHYLKVHLKIHTGERAFSCDICECKFSSKRTLNSHLRCHKSTGDG